MKRLFRPAVKCAALLLGASVAVGMLAGRRVPAQDTGPGAYLTLSASASGSARVRPVGPLIENVELRPSPARRALESTFELANRSGAPVRYGLRAQATVADLDSVLRVEITSGRQRLFRGPLLELRRSNARALLLGPRESRSVTVRVWIPSSTLAGYQNRDESVTVQFYPQTAGTA